MEGLDKDLHSDTESGPTSGVVSAEPAAAPSGDGPVDGLPAADEIDTLRAELEALRDLAMRQAAEFQNYRRRTELEKSQSVALGKTLVVMQLLDVVDDLRRSIEAADQVGESPDPAAAPEFFATLRTGVRMVFDKLWGELERLGVEEIRAVGSAFDETEHEALLRQPAAEGVGAGVVVAEVQKGYRMGDRVLRHARVVVTV